MQVSGELSSLFLAFWAARDSFKELTLRMREDGICFLGFELFGKETMLMPEIGWCFAMSAHFRLGDVMRAIGFGG